MIVPLMVMMLIASFFFVWRFVRGLNDLVIMSRAKNIPIFGIFYSSAVRLYSDFNFTADLFSGEKIRACEDEGMKELLNRLRRYLNFQLFFGCGVFFMIIINGFLR